MAKQTFAALTLATGLTLSGAAFADPAKFDGAWSVHLVTNSGVCDSSSSATLTVSGGHVRAGGSGVSVSGQVGANGSVNLALQKGPAQGTASGRLSATSGSGTWTVSTIGCSGRWTGQRRSSITAQTY